MLAVTETNDLLSRLSKASGPVVLYGAGFFARLALFGLRKHGYEASHICDSDSSKHGANFCGFTVQPVEDLVTFEETAEVFITSIYVIPIMEKLKTLGFKNIYSCTNLFKSIDYTHADLDLDDVPETFEYGQSPWNSFVWWQVNPPIQYDRCLFHL